MIVNTSGLQYSKITDTTWTIPGEDMGISMAMGVPPVIVHLIGIVPL